MVAFGLNHLHGTSSKYSLAAGGIVSSTHQHRQHQWSDTSHCSRTSHRFYSPSFLVLKGGLKPAIKRRKVGGSDKNPTLHQLGGFADQPKTKKYQHLPPKEATHRHEEPPLNRSKTQKKQLRPFTKTQPLQPPFSLFVSCLPGLEPFLLKEIDYLREQWQQFAEGDDENGTSSAQQKALKPKSIPGGVKVSVPSLTHLYILKLYLGTASHVYLRLNDGLPDDDKGNRRGNTAVGSENIPTLFRARGFPELQRKLKELMLAQKWNSWLDFSVNKRPKSKSASSTKCPLWDLQIHVTTSKSKLMHTKAVEERVRQTMGEVLGVDLVEEDTSNTPNDKANATEQQRPIVRILVRIERDLVQLSLDVSSSCKAVPMHMRGYRLNPHKAPLREDLAFALLMAGGLEPCWDLNPQKALLGGDFERIDEVDTLAISAEPILQLFDPCCGSGTIAIEGAGMLAGYPPGRKRDAPLQGTKLCDVELWEELKSNAMAASSSNQNILVTANDVNMRAIEATKANAKRAGVDDLLSFTRGSFQTHPLFKQSPSNSHPPLYVVTNPPYGKRLPRDTTSNVYKQLAEALTQQYPSKVKYALIGNDPRPLRETGLSMEVSFSTRSGGLSVVAMSTSMNKASTKE